MRDIPLPLQDFTNRYEGRYSRRSATAADAFGLI
jgi:hypothetical protein